MAERRKNKKKKESEVKEVDEKPSKEEYAVAKFLKAKLPEKKTTLLGHKVEYFIGCKAVDLLAESSWAKENKKGELNFSNRDIAIDFMARLLEHKFFHRAKKIVILKEPKKPKKKDKEKEQEDQDSGKEGGKSKSEEKDGSKSKSEEKKEGGKSKSEEKKEGGKSKSEEKKEGGKSKSDEKKEGGKSRSDEKKEGKKESEEVVEKEKVRKKIKLDMHLDQRFIDSNEPYVWIYDPIPLKTWVTGTLMVVAAVLLCLFPLWPQTIRHYIYYLSVAAAFLLVFIIGLAVLRVVVFVVVWCVTFGKHHLWLMPNLLEDVGFFESFWPLYKYDYKGNKDEKKEEEKEEGKETKKEKENKEEKENEENESKDNNEDKQEGGEEEEEGSDSSDEAQKTENGFEFLEAEELGDEDRKTK